MEPDKVNKDDVVQRVINYMESDTNAAKIGIYTVAGLLFGVAYFKKRPITQFTKPSKIPDSFVLQRLKQKGKVQYVEPHLDHGPLLRVHHYPPLNIFSSSKKTLPIKLAGVELNSNGFSWLQNVVVDHQVEFIPLKKQSDHVECLVFMDSKKHVDLAEALLSLGFARVGQNLPQKIENDKKLERYYKLLRTVETSAKKNRVGDWRLQQSYFAIRLLRDTIDKLIYQITPKPMRLPKLVRP